MVQSMHYPDEGHMIGDRSVLRNAILFTTSMRAYAANRIIAEVARTSNEYELTYLGVDAFSQYVLSLEDLLGWLFVLKDWAPGTADRCLFALLDTVQVGSRQWTEEKAIELLESLDAESFRQLVHLPTSSQLRDYGLQEKYINKLDKAMPHQLAGFREGSLRRASKNRAIVRAYNKSKHMLLGVVVRDEEGKLNVHLLTSETGYQDREKGIGLAGAIVSSQKTAIQTHVDWVLQTQGVLNTLLGSILYTRFGEWIDSSKWVWDAFNGTGWNTNADQDRSDNDS